MTAGIRIDLRIGQRVRVTDDYMGKPVIGTVRGLYVNEDGALKCDVALDEPLVIPPLEPDSREIRIHRQDVYAQDVLPYDERDELARLVLTLNPASQEIGLGMLAQLQALARKSMEGGAA